MLHNHRHIVVGHFDRIQFIQQLVILGFVVGKQDHVHLRSGTVEPVQHQDPQRHHHEAAATDQLPHGLAFFGDNVGHVFHDGGINGGSAGVIGLRYRRRSQPSKRGSEDQQQQGVFHKSHDMVGLVQPVEFFLGCPGRSRFRIFFYELVEHRLGFIDLFLLRKGAGHFK